MVWQRIDDQFGVSQKVIRIPRKRRQQCVGLWTLVGNFAVRALTDGVVEAHELDELDARPMDIAELVRVDLWHHEGHRCGSCVPAPVGGIVIHDFLAYNPSRSAVEEGRRAERERKAEQRSRKSAPRPTGTPDGTPVGSDAASEHPVPSRPGPLSDAERSGQVTDREASPQGGDNRLGSAFQLARPIDVQALRSAIAAACERQPTDLHAVAIAQQIIERAGDPDSITNWTGFAIRAVQNDWPEWQQLIDATSGGAS